MVRFPAPRALVPCSLRPQRAGRRRGGGPAVADGDRPGRLDPCLDLADRRVGRPGSFPATPDLVDLSQWWTTHGPWQSVLAFIVAHPPTGTTQDASGTATVGTIVSSSVTDALPTAGPRFNTRQVLLEVAPLPGGGVGVRVDAQVIWYPTRPAAEHVPVRATLVRASVFRQTSLTDTVPVVLATATFTSPSVVARLARKVDSLPLALPGTRSCPADRVTIPSDADLLRWSRCSRRRRRRRPQRLWLGLFHQRRDQ